MTETDKEYKTKDYTRKAIKDYWTRKREDPVFMEETKKKRHEYYESKKAHIKERSKGYYERNKEAIKQKRKERLEADALKLQESLGGDSPLSPSS